MRDSDVQRFVEAVARRHPDPFRAVTRAAFECEAERAAGVEDAGSRPQAVCALLRLGAALGERNGHSGIFPLDSHREPLHFYPLRPYEFDDGCFVVSAADPDLVGTEVVEIGGVPVASLSRQVEPLISRDNEATVLARRPGYLITAEILEGLGAGSGPRSRFLLRRPTGDALGVELEPVPAREYVAVVDANSRLPPRPGARYLERRDEAAWVERLSPSGVVVVGYNLTRGDAQPLADEIGSAVGRAPAIVLDLRHNGGGNNTTYGPLLAELERRSQSTPLLVLTSRHTFSAAMQLVVDLERKTNAVFVGEATGGSPNQFGDAVQVELPATGLVAHVATIHWETAGAGDRRLTREPDIHVPLGSQDFFAGRDRVLDTATNGVLGG